MQVFLYTIYSTNQTIILKQFWNNQTRRQSYSLLDGTSYQNDSSVTDTSYMNHVNSIELVSPWAIINFIVTSSDSLSLFLNYHEWIMIINHIVCDCWQYWEHDWAHYYYHHRLRLQFFVVLVHLPNNLYI